jgi:hypothetical protein
MKTTQTFSILIWASRLKNSIDEATICARITVDGLRFTGEKEEKRTILQVFDYHNDQMAKIIGIDLPFFFLFSNMFTIFECSMPMNTFK